MPLGFLTSGLLGGAASGLASIFGGSASVPNAYNFQNTSQADNTFGSALTGASGDANQSGQFTRNITENPYAGGYQSAAGAAGGQFGSLGTNATGASGSLYGAGSSVLPYASQILQNGFDPQNALYARTQQQVQDQTGAQLAATGVGATPFGAGVMGQTNSNFNIDWQNNELQRQATAAQGAGSLYGTAEGLYGAGGQQGTLGAGATLQSGAVPYQTQNSINQAALGALGTQQQLYSGSAGLADQYLGLATGQGYNDQLEQYNAQNLQNQQSAAGIGSLFGAIGGAFGGGGNGGGYGTTQIASGSLPAQNYSIYQGLNSYYPPITTG